MNQTARRALVFATYFALLLAATYPQSLAPASMVGHVPDPVESTYILSWVAHQVVTDPLHLFDANFMHPYGHALAFTDHRFLPSLLVAPVIWTTGNAVLAYNVCMALGLLLAAYGARRLGTALGLEALGAWTAGALYAFHTSQIHEAERLNLLFHGFLPLALEQLVLLLRGRGRRPAWKFAGLVLAIAYSSNYLLLYSVFLCGLIVVAAAVARPREVAPRLVGLLLPAAVAAALFAPVALTYVRHFSEHRLARELPEGLAVAHYLHTMPTNLFWGPRFDDVTPRHRPHFLGWGAIGLGSASMFPWRRSTPDGSPSEDTLLSWRVWVPAALALALLLIALSLGRDIRLFDDVLSPGPYRFLYDWLPGFRLVRFPERLGLLAMLFVGLLVGRSVSLLRWAGLPVVATVLAAFIPLEHLSPGALGALELPTGAAVPSIYRWLADEPVRAVADLPVRGPYQIKLETLPMYYSTYHWKPIVQGYSAFQPPVTRALRDASQHFPARESIEELAAAGVDVAVVHLPPASVLEVYDRIPRGRRSLAFRRHFDLEDVMFYRGLRNQQARGRLVEAAGFEDRTVLPGGRDVAFRLRHVPRPGAAKR